MTRTSPHPALRATLPTRGRETISVAPIPPLDGEGVGEADGWGEYPLVRPC
jgi:hypothetical protein